MYSPNVSVPTREETYITRFGGLNLLPSGGVNEFSYEQNMSSLSHPFPSPRNKHALFQVTGTDLQGLFGKNEICYLNGGRLYIGGTQFTGHSFPDINVPRQTVSMGAYLVIFPDKFYINTKDTTDYGSLESTFVTENGTAVTFSLCKADGTVYTEYTVSDTPPISPVNGDLWVDTSVTPHVLKQFSSSAESWVEYASTYVRIATANIGRSFCEGDGITVSGALDSSFNGTFTVQGCGNDYLVISGILGNTQTQTTPLTVTRSVPDMDFVCENGNRLWGCNSERNEIYASKLGDMKNFHVYNGISTDSYAVTVGTDGEFTAAVSYRGYVLFFKENALHKIYGSNPPFTVTSSEIRGVQKGSERSLVCLNETLYYKSVTGVCAYDGGVPISISDNLGDTYYRDAAGGKLLNRYFICMSDKNGVRTLFCFDEKNGVWHREGNIDIREFALHNSNLYFIATDRNTKRLYLYDGENTYGNFAGTLSGYSLEHAVSWEAVSCLFGLESTRQKYYSALNLRILAESTGTLSLWIQCNESLQWTKISDFSVSGTKTYDFPVALPRCDTFRLKLMGSIKIKLLGLSLLSEKGSELHG